MPAPRTFVILHGIANHRPPEHWQHRLADELRGRGEAVAYPGLPEPDEPVFERWAQVVAALLDRAEGERVVICHSLSCLLWLRMAMAGTATADRLLLVSPPDPARVPPAGKGFVQDGLDGGALRASVRGPIRIARGDADPFDPRATAASLAAGLAAEVDVLPAAGHITPETGYGAWPSALDWCLDPSARLTSARADRLDQRVDAFIEALPDWQQAICRRVRTLMHLADLEMTETIKRTRQPYFVLQGNVAALLAAKDHLNVFLYDPIAPDPHGIITAGRDNKTARTVGLRRGDELDEDAFVELVRAIVANNRAGGWRRLV
jgi:predicted alpha/beta hydrolase family esterase